MSENNKPLSAAQPVSDETPDVRPQEAGKAPACPSGEQKQQMGVFHKFRVERTDGKSAPGEKHHNCEYFVLDTIHDPHAKPALLAYADSCEAKYPKLADDARRMANGERLLTWSGGTVGDADLPDATQELGKGSPACHHHRITPECPECDKGKAPACDAPSPLNSDQLSELECALKIGTRQLTEDGHSDLGVYSKYKLLAKKYPELILAARNLDACRQALSDVQEEAISLRARFQESSEEYRKGLDVLRAENESFRAKYTEAGGRIMDLERQLANQQRGCADEISALVGQRNAEQVEVKRLRARVETLEAALTYMVERFDGVDNGYCKICGDHRQYDSQGKAGPCQSPVCQSHANSAALKEGK